MDQRLRRWDEVSDEERARLLLLKRQRRLHEVFSSLNLRMRYDSLQRKLNDYEPQYEAEQRASQVQLNAAQHSPMPPSPTKKYDDFEVIETDDVIIISDLEIPDHNPLYLLYALLVAMRFGIRNLIILGDFIATDQDALTDWPTLVRGNEMSLQSVSTLMKSVIYRFLMWFLFIWFVEGNHDERVARKTGGEVHLGMLLPQQDNVRYSRYQYLWIKTKRGYVYACHPRQYSANSVGLGQKIYNKLRAPDGTKPISVVLGHTHQAQTGTSPDGHAEIIALGTLRDKDRTKYKALSANTHHEWENGFLMIRNGYFYPLTSRSDWRFWLDDKYPDDTQETSS